MTYSALGDLKVEEKAASLTSKTKDISFISITGEIETSNTHGYLSADEYPLLHFYMGMAIAYLVIDSIWIFLCVKFFENLILLHHFFSMILLT
jgi:hypothetical protein